MTIEIEHGQNAERTAVDTSEELDEILDALAEEARNNTLGRWVHIFEMDGNKVRKMLGLGLGRDYSVMQWVDKTKRAHSRSVGTGGITEWLYAGIPSSVDPGSTVDVESVRDAAREFLATRERPTNVSWTN